MYTISMQSVLKLPLIILLVVLLQCATSLQVHRKSLRISTALDLSHKGTPLQQSNNGHSSQYRSFSSRLTPLHLSSNNAMNPLTDTNVLPAANSTSIATFARNATTEFTALSDPKSNFPKLSAFQKLKAFMLLFRRFTINKVLLTRGAIQKTFLIVLIKTITSLQRLMSTRTGMIKLFTGIVLFFASLMSLMKKTSKAMEMSYSGFMKLLEMYPDKIKHIVVSSQTLAVHLEGRTLITRVVPANEALMTKLLASGVEFSAAASPKNFIGIVSSLIYLFMMFRLFKMMQGPQDESVGKRKDRMNLNAYGDLSFEDVAGQAIAKLEVKEVVEMLKDSSRYRAIGARLPSGILLNGPPGTGKTLLARVTAAEAKVPFFSCSASDFVEVYVGRGPARVRKLFKTAAQCAPCIVFIDEIDSIGRSRKNGNINSEQENTLNQLLTCMDGLDTSNNGVIVMAATNRLDTLDPALLRAGRFDRIVQCPLPDRVGREEILAVQCKKLRIGSDVVLERIARVTPGTSGADLSTIVNEAAIRAVRRKSETVDLIDFEDALKSFYSTRSVSIAGLAEVAGGGNLLPGWLKTIFNGNTTPPPNAAGVAGG